MLFTAGFRKNRAEVVSLIVLTVINTSSAFPAPSIEDEDAALRVLVEVSFLSAFWFWFERERGFFVVRCGNGGSVNGTTFILTLKLSLFRRLI